MKKIMIVMLALTLGMGASAQKVAKGIGSVHRAPHVHFYAIPYSYGFGFGYPYFGYPYMGIPPYGYPYYYRQRRMPYQLSVQIDAIKSDYQQQIKEVRDNKGLAGKERREQIRNLKTKRDEDIVTAKKDFVRAARNNRNPGMNNNQDNNHNNGSQNQNGNQNNSDNTSFLQS